VITGNAVGAMALLLLVLTAIANTGMLQNRQLTPLLQRNPSLAKRVMWTRNPTMAIGLCILQPFMGRTKVVLLLLANGNVDAKNRNGETALQMLIRNVLVAMRAASISARCSMLAGLTCSKIGPVFCAAYDLLICTPDARF
jgi:hypothetical protein